MLPTVVVPDLRSRLHDIEDTYVHGIGEEDQDGIVPESKSDRYEEAWKTLRRELSKVGSEKTGDRAE
ncbi:hypothetical protein HT576_09125 [Haloterrigena sp. SYSU A121-1]|uniref:Uncharacterized protein n=1 Tax=Haloterrigena gelatinilytica TaxID=2741724 RepID=A0A8J8KF41_9EURY|nr:hypothetical protein [Haloterrigena gelatinilytica]NUB91181.1 hypothetical protein [Haloterrigena gelatinilytica]